jgi:hypothetical protein
LPKEYNKLWVFGDSYCTTGFFVDPQDSFWGLAAEYLHADKIVNTSWSGNSWTSVQQTLIGQQQEYNWEQDYFLIGIPVLERLTVFDNYKDTQYKRQVLSKDWTVQDEPLLCHTGLEIIKGHLAQNMAIYLDRAWVETQTLNSIFLLTQWLDSKKANYVIHTLGKAFDANNMWGPTTFNLGYCKDHPRCILFENTYNSVNINLNKPVDFDQYRWNGHHGPAGNKHFFETSLKDKLC